MTENLTSNPLKAEYIKMLKNVPFDNPKAEEVKGLFPHLSIDEVRRVLTLGEKKSYRHIALPPLRVDRQYQLVMFNKEHTLYGITFPKILTFDHFADRLIGRYSPYYKKAVRFARNNWGNDLVIDNWVDYVTIILNDPKDLSGFIEGYPTPKTAVYFTTTRSWKDILNDCSKPQSQVIDDAIAEMTTSLLIGNELQGQGRCNGYFYTNCAYDGAALGIFDCKECRSKFKPNPSLEFEAFLASKEEYCVRDSRNWHTPLPSKLANLLVSEGFKFGQDPAIAREKEAQEFYQHQK